MWFDAAQESQPLELASSLVVVTLALAMNPFHL